VPTSTRPGRNGWPRGQRVGGRTIHCPDVDRTEVLEALQAEGITVSGPYLLQLRSGRRIRPSAVTGGPRPLRPYQDCQSADFA